MQFSAKDAVVVIIFRMYQPNRVGVSSNVDAIAIGQAKKEIIRMANYAKEQLDFSITSIFARNHREREELFEKLKRREETVNLLEHEIASFLISIDQQSITEEMAKTTAAYLHLIHDIEQPF